MNDAYLSILAHVPQDHALQARARHQAVGQEDRVACAAADHAEHTRRGIAEVRLHNRHADGNVGLARGAAAAKERPCTAGHQLCSPLFSEDKSSSCRSGVASHLWRGGTPQAQPNLWNGWPSPSPLCHVWAHAWDHVGDHAGDHAGTCSWCSFTERDEKRTDGRRAVRDTPCLARMCG